MSVVQLGAAIQYNILCCVVTFSSVVSHCTVMLGAAIHGSGVSDFRSKFKGKVSTLSQSIVKHRQTQ